MTGQHRVATAVGMAVLAALVGGWAAPARSQRIPQVTGWTFSRSSGMGMRTRTAVSSRSDSSGLEVVVESGNVRQIERPDGSTAFEIVDPSQKFGSASQSSRSDERSRSQGLSFFTLSDWGYSVFTN